jgi:hypothetical protein
MYQHLRNREIDQTAARGGQEADLVLHRSAYNSNNASGFVENAVAKLREASGAHPHPPAALLSRLKMNRVLLSVIGGICSCSPTTAGTTRDRRDPHGRTISTPTFRTVTFSIEIEFRRPEE